MTARLKRRTWTADAGGNPPSGAQAARDLLRAAVDVSGSERCFFINGTDSAGPSIEVRRKQGLPLPRDPVRRHRAAPPSPGGRSTTIARRPRRAGARAARAGAVDLRPGRRRQDRARDPLPRAISVGSRADQPAAADDRCPRPAGRDHDGLCRSLRPRAAGLSGARELAVPAQHVQRDRRDGGERSAQGRSGHRQAVARLPLRARFTRRPDRHTRPRARDHPGLPRARAVTAR